MTRLGFPSERDRIKRSERDKNEHVRRGRGLFCAKPGRQMRQVWGCTSPREDHCARVHAAGFFIRRPSTFVYVRGLLAAAPAAATDGVMCARYCWAVFFAAGELCRLWLYILLLLMDLDETDLLKNWGFLCLLINHDR